MERDFMGLGAKVKQEISEAMTDSAIGRSSTMQQRLVSEKGSVPQILSFDSSKVEKPKVGFEALASAGLITITTAEAVEPSHKQYSSPLQKNMVREKRGYRYTALTLPPKAIDSPSLDRHHEARRLHNIAISAYQTGSLAMSNPASQSFVSTAGQNLICSTNWPPLPLTSSVQAKGNTNAVVGTTELRNTSMATGAPAQLTIFYAGSVCVYDDVPPEKAQAIMLLAGNGASVGSSPPVAASPVQSLVVRPSMCSVMNPSHNMTSSPVSVACISSSHSVGGTACPVDAAAVRNIVTLNTPPSKEDPPKIVTSLGLVSATILPSGSAVPQFRKASLARFLEKRKERVLSASPYSSEERHYQDCSTPRSGSTSISINASGPCLLPSTS